VGRFVDIAPADLDVSTAEGMMLEFALIVAKERTYAEDIRVRRYQSGEQDPLTAQRLKLLERLNAAAAAVAADVLDSRYLTSL
jgi:hypothetical protein